MLKKNTKTAKLKMLRDVEFFPDPAAPVRVHRAFTRGTDLHRHEFVELVLVLSGRGGHVAGTSRSLIEPGHVLIVAPGRSHAYEPGPGLSVINLIIRRTFLREQARTLRWLPGLTTWFSGSARPFPPPVRLGQKDAAACEELAGRIEAEGFTRAPGYAAMQVAWLLALLGRICRAASAHAPEPDVRGRERLEPVLALLEREYRRELPLAELAVAAHLSTRSLLRHFRLATGTTPHQYLLRIRLAQAGRMLRETRAPVVEVALACGFRDGNAFSTAFRRRTGAPPRRRGNANVEHSTSNVQR